VESAVGLGKSLLNKESTMKHISKIFGLFISLLLTLSVSVVFAQSMAEMEFTSGWIRATPPNAKMGAAYLTVMNHQDQADELIGASSSLAEVVEIHNVKEENGMLKMYPVNSLEIPAKGMVMLKPGGYHIMLINLKQAPKLGESHTMTLQFRHAPDLTVELPVQQSTAARDDEKPSMHHHQSHKSQ
jgi:copper(I)-binding protein